MVSIAIPSSCVGNQTCYSLQQATYTLHEICRAAVLFKVDEIIVYECLEPEIKEQGIKEQKKIVFGDEADEPKSKRLDTGSDSEEASETKNIGSVQQSSKELAVFAANMLQYFITAPHLRGALFKDTKMYKIAKKLPKVPGLRPLTSKLVDGIAIKKAAPRKKGKLSKKEKAVLRTTPYVNIGGSKLYKLEEEVPVNSRVVMDVKEGKPVTDAETFGYTVRAVQKFSQIFTESKSEYSHTFYVPSQQFTAGADSKAGPMIMTAEQPFKADNALLVFGKWSQVEQSVKLDQDLEIAANELFDGLLAGTESARLEDSVMVTLAKN